MDKSGNLYVADTYDCIIAKVTPGGVITTVAGKAGVYGSQDGAGTAAEFSKPYGVAVDGSGTIYVADTGNNTIRKITPDGLVSTLAGTAGYNGTADGTGANARFRVPVALTVDPTGNVFVVDTSTIRKITPAGVVTTFAGSSSKIGYLDGTALAAYFSSPTGITCDAAGNLYVADSGNGVVRKITQSAVVTTYVGSSGTGGSSGPTVTADLTTPGGVTVDSAGNLFITDSLQWNVIEVSASGSVVTLYNSLNEPPGMQLYEPGSIAVDGSGNVYLAEPRLDVIQEVSASGILSDFAGLIPGSNVDGTGSQARFDSPIGAAVDAAGNVYVGDFGNNVIRKVTPGGVVTTIAGTPSVDGSSNGTGAAALFNAPTGTAVDSLGDVFVADSGNNCIREISPAGVVSTYAGIGGRSNGNFSQPRGVAVDNSGNVFVADTGNDCIWMIYPTGLIVQLAGMPGVSGSVDGTGSTALFNGPTGISVDNAGNIYVADFKNLTIRKITYAGVVTTVAGSPGMIGNVDGVGSAARFLAPVAVAADSSGNLFVADLDGYIRKIASDGTVTTVGGLPSGDADIDGIGTAAGFNQSGGIGIDSAGNLYIADTGNDCIRKGLLTQFTQPPPTGGPLSFVAQPSSQTIATGGTVVFSAAVGTSSSASQAADFQWYYDGTKIAGATNSTYVIYGATAANDGTYSCTAIDTSGAVQSSEATLNVVPSANAGRITNLSVRAQVGTGTNIMTAGFVSGGDNTSGTQPILIRGSGPALGVFGLTGLLPDPKLTLTNVGVTPNTVIATDTGWAADPAILSAAYTLGAFSWGTAPTADSALLRSVAPGNYTAEIAGASGDTGLALVEVYDATPAGSYVPSSPRLVNLSALVQVGAGANSLVAGFVVGGATAKTVLVRASGPALSQNPFNLPGTLPDPQLTLTNTSVTPNVTISVNAGWQGDPTIGAVATKVGAFSWGLSSADSAILITLPPGNYTAGIKGASGDTGLALVELYEVD